MKIIDLSLPIESGMPVFPGDPEVEIEQVLNLAEHGWNMSRLHMNSHDGTHVNVPFHAIASGKNLDDYNLAAFFGPAVIYKPGMNFNSDTGVIFVTENIDWEIAKRLVETPAKFVGLAAEFEFDVEIEKYLLEQEILSYERLANTKELPAEFMFYGLPLSFKGGDGSPVRALAITG